MTRGGVQPIDQRVKRRRKGRRECRWRRLVRQLAMKGHGSALYAAGSDAYLGHILCSLIASDLASSRSCGLRLAAPPLFAYFRLSVGRAIALSTSASHLDERTNAQRAMKSLSVPLKGRKEKEKPERRV